LKNEIPFIKDGPLFSFSADSNKYEHFIFDDKYFYLCTTRGRFEFKPAFMHHAKAVYRTGKYYSDSAYNIFRGLVPYDTLYRWYHEIFKVLIPRTRFDNLAPGAKGTCIIQLN